jgi:hypothetical protein
VATGADASATVTLTSSTSHVPGAIWYTALVILQFRLASAATISLDLHAGIGETAGSAVSTFSVSPASGSLVPSFTDELVVTAAVGRVIGLAFGTNTFAGTAGGSLVVPAGFVGICSPSGSGNAIYTQYLLQAQASATAGTNVFTNTMDTASNTLGVLGATFSYV